jgi:hypothetical protein
VLAVIGAYLVVGVVCGVLWWWLWDPAMFTKVRGGGGSMGEVQLGRRFAADGWYVVIAAVAGLVLGAGMMLWRTRDVLLTTILVVLGSGVAAGAMVVTGHLLGPVDPDVALASVAPGTEVPTQLGVSSAAVYLVWPIATLVAALVVLWAVPGRFPEGPPSDGR